MLQFVENDVHVRAINMELFVQVCEFTGLITGQIYS